MKAAFHYSVRVKLIRYESKDKIDFITHEKIFENDNPICARDKAFEEYQAWIDDLYTGMGNDKYFSDERARIDLQRFISVRDKSKFPIGELDIETGDRLELGIGVYFIVNQPYKEVNPFLADEVGDERIIHGIGTSDEFNDPLEISDSLNTEIMYYEKFGYDKAGHQRSAKVWDWDIESVESFEYLATPYDWTGADTPPTATNDDFFNVDRAINIEEIIRNGEGNQVEFKPCLLYNFKTQRAGISVKQHIAKAICAFLNSDGGLLLIGIKNDGSVQGLKYDFSLSEGENPKDFFKLEFDQMLEHFLSFTVKPNVKGEFIEIDGKTIFKVSVSPLFQMPVFVSERESEIFYTRGEASSRPLKTPREIVEYWINRWNSNQK